MENYLMENIEEIQNFNEYEVEEYKKYINDIVETLIENYTHIYNIKIDKKRNKELIEKLIQQAQNHEKWSYYKNLLTNHTVKIRRNKEEYDIISPGFEKNYRITWYEHDKPVGHAEFSNTFFDVGQLITEYIWEDWTIEEII